MGAPDSDPVCAAEPRGSRLRRAAIVFILFLVVISDPFIVTVLSPLGARAVEGRTPRAWGYVVLGGCLALGVTLAESAAAAGWF
jgi:hypothetical protein